MQTGTAPRDYDYPTSAKAQAVKEIGIIDRANGLSSGLSDLREKLENFGARCGLHSPPKNADPSPIPNGIPTVLSAAENNLRECHHLLSRFNDAF